MSKRKSKKKEDQKGQTVVEEVQENQPQNPFTEIQILSHHSDFVRLLTKIDSSRCASATDDCRVILWDIIYGRRLHVLHGHSRPVTSMCVLYPSISSVDNLVLITGASDKIIVVWDVESGNVQYRLTDYEAAVRCLLVLSDGELFCAGGEKLCLWDRNGRLLHKHERTEEEDIQRMIVMRGHLLVTVVDEKLVTYSLQTEVTSDGESWRIQTFRKLPPHRESIKSLIVINDGCFASGSLDGTVYLWAVPAMTQIKKFNFMQDYQGDNKMYPYSIQHMICAEERYIFCAVGSGISVYDVITDRLMAQKLNAHYSKVLHLQFVYNGHFLASCSEDGSIRLWGSRRPQPALEPTLSDSIQTEQDEMHRFSTVMEKFFGKKKEEFFQASNAVLQPKLLGECVAHSGAVQMCIEFESEGFVSSGVDGLLIAWKDGVRRNQCRNEMIREMLIGDNVAGIV